MRHRFGFIALLALASACVPKHGSYDGTIQGDGFDVADAAYFSKFYDAATTGYAQSVTATVLVISSSYTMCDDVQRQLVYPNEQFLTFIFGSTDTTGLGELKGDFSIGQYGDYQKETAQCQPAAQGVVSTSGTLHFDDGNYQSGGNADGTFNIVFDSGDSGSGTFSATPCGSMEHFLDQVVDASFGGQSQSGPIYLIDGTCA